MLRFYIRVKVKDGWLVNIEFGIDLVYSELVGWGMVIFMVILYIWKKIILYGLGFLNRNYCKKKSKCIFIKWLLYFLVKIINLNNILFWKVVIIGVII